MENIAAPPLDSRSDEPGWEPADYWYFLPEERAERAYTRIYWHFYRKVGLHNIAEDCTNDACLRLLEYRRVLEMGPRPIAIKPSAEWCDATENALVMFALSMTKAVIANFYRKNVSRLVAAEEEAEQLEDNNSNIEGNIAAIATHQVQLGFFGDLRARLLAKQRTLVVHVLDRLTQTSETQTSVIEVMRASDR